MKTVIFKATDRCNSNCVYCHAIRKNNPVPTMPFDILEQFFIKANAFLTQWPEETLKIIWHGGEPLILKPEYYYQALGYKETICRDTGSRISFDMQSNLTLFSREYVDVLKKMGIQSFGTSFYLLPGVRGSGGTEGSDRYNRQFIRATSLLEEEGFSWGIIYVVTKLALENPLELFRILTNFVPSASVMFNPVTFYPEKPGQVAITPEEFVDFLGAIFPQWWRKRDRYPGVDPFSSLVENLINGNRSLICIDSGRCADTHLSISPDGMVWQCGRSSDWGLMSYGSIMDFSLTDIMNHPQKDLMRKRNAILQEGECKGCRFWDICHGGCPLDALAEHGSLLHKSPWCWTKKGFIEKYFEPVTGVTYQPSSGQAQAQQTLRGETITIPEFESRPPAPPAGECSTEESPWIGPINRIDDVLMISGILQQLVEENPSRRFNLVNKASYRELLEGHPAISSIGRPPQGTVPLCLDYGDSTGPTCPARAYQAIADLLGLATPAEERLCVPWQFEDDPVLRGLIPWRARNILICPAAESQRARMDVQKWEDLVKRLVADGFGVMQIASIRHPHIRGACGIRGLSSLKQIISFTRNFDLIITSHNLFMHAAQLHGIPAIVLWGPSDHTFYGYEGHYHLQGPRACHHAQGCLVHNQTESPCPMADEHCMDLIEVDTIHQTALEAARSHAAQTRTSPEPGIMEGAAWQDFSRD